MAVSDKGNIVVIPLSIMEGFYMFSVDKPKHEGILQHADVEKFSEDGINYYDLQVCHNPCSGDTFKTFNIRATDTHAEEAMHAIPTTPNIVRTISNTLAKNSTVYDTS